MLRSEDIMPLIQSLIWLLAGVGVFIVGMNFLSDALEKTQGEIKEMFYKVLEMFDISKDAFENFNKARLATLSELENDVDTLKRDLMTKHFARLAEGSCRVEVSPYYSSAISGLERVADHLVNVGYSIVNPVGSQREED